MRMPRAKGRYQRAELSKSLPFPPPCSVWQRGCLSCHSLAWHPEVLAPAWLSSPSVLAAGDSPALPPLGLGILVLAGKPIQTSVLSWVTMFLVDRVCPGWDSGLQTASVLGQSSMVCRDTGGQLHPMLLIHAAARMGAHISWHHWRHIFKPMAAGTQRQDLA